MFRGFCQTPQQNTWSAGWGIEGLQSYFCNSTEREKDRETKRETSPELTVLFSLCLSFPLSVPLCHAMIASWLQRKHNAEWRSIYQSSTIKSLIKGIWYELFRSFGDPGRAWTHILEKEKRVVCSTCQLPPLTLPQDWRLCTQLYGLPLSKPHIIVKRLSKSPLHKLLTNISDMSKHMLIPIY